MFICWTAPIAIKQKISQNNEILYQIMVYNNPAIQMNKCRIVVKIRTAQKEKNILYNSLSFVFTCKGCPAPYVETLKSRDWLSVDQGQIEYTGLGLRIDAFCG